MSVPDYHQRIDDHQSILILVRHIGTQDNPLLSPKAFGRIYDRIKRLCEVKIQDAQGMGCERIIRLRYCKNDYHPENNEWGDFQAHRRVFGLITVAAVVEDEELTAIYEQHDTVLNQYSNSVLDSRCLVFKLPGRPASDRDSTPSADSGTVITSNGGSSNIEENGNGKLLPKTTLATAVVDGDPLNASLNSNASSNLSDERTSSNNNHNTTGNHPNHNHSAGKQLAAVQTVIYGNSNSSRSQSINDMQQSTDALNLHGNELTLEKDIEKLITSLFWVLESKRLDRSYEKMDRVPLLMAPFETKTMVGVDTDTRNFKKRCLGRMKKHIADLSLLAGLPTEALTMYANAVGILKSVNDFLWLAAAHEGQCVASIALLYPQLSRRKISLQRNASLPPNKFKQLQENVAADVTDTSAGGGKPKKKPSFVTLSSQEGDDAGSAREAPSKHNSLPTQLDANMVKVLGKNLLANPMEIYDRYKEACCHYAKFKPVAVIEMECSFKAARILTTLEKYMAAAEFIQNAVFISLSISSEEQIHRLTIIADLYAEIGYHRKSAFYKRFAALKAVSLNIANPNWERCYYLLLPALDGYHLTLDPLDYEQRSMVTNRAIGWIGIHLQLLQELITTARRMRLDNLAVRHLSFLLHALFEFLTPTQRQEFSSQLLSLTEKSGQDQPKPIGIENGFVIPLVSLTKFPYITSFKPQALAPHLRPFKQKNKLDVKTNSSPSSPFIYTPLSINRPLNRGKQTGKGGSQLQEFKWVQNEPCEVQVTVNNFLPNELVISNIALLTEGLEFEQFKSTLKMEPECGQVSLSLTGVPRGHGKLSILGYETDVLGVTSKCYLKELPRRKGPENYCVEVIPPLPLVTLACPDLDKASMPSPLTGDGVDFVVGTYNLSLFMGEKRTCSIRLTNTSGNEELVELAQLRIVSKLPKQEELRLVTLPSCDMSDKLPLAPGASIDIPIELFGIGDFVAPVPVIPQGSSSAGAVASGSASPMYNPPHSGFSSPSHQDRPKKQTLQIGTALANFLSDLQSSDKNAAGLKAPQIDHPLSGSSPDASHDYPSKIIDLMVEVEYSGGTSLGYCRKSALRFIIEIFPSVLITHWDVLPAETPSRCFLVLDILNAANVEMELKYSTNKSILIEAKETCRIPVPVDRCPLTAAGPKDGQTSGTAATNRVPTALHLQDRCKAHLAEQVSLNYTLLGAVESKGIASIATIEWNSVMLNTILLSPLQWEVALNGKHLATEKPEYTIGVGDTMTCAISISNCSDHPLRSLCLWMQLYQDHQNGTRNYRLDQKRALFGCDKIFIEEIEPKQTYQHECSFIFFYTGLFKLEIQCSGYDCGSNPISTEISLNDSGLAKSQQQHQQHTGTYFQQQQQLRADRLGPPKNSTTQGSGCSKDSGPCLWKCMPAIEINVADYYLKY